MKIVHDKDVLGTWMVYDEDEPDTVDVICRGIPNEKLARKIAEAMQDKLSKEDY